MYIHHEQYELSDQVAERLSDKDKNHISSQFITRITANNSYLNHIPYLLTAYKPFLEDKLRLYHCLL